MIIDRTSGARRALRRDLPNRAASALTLAQTVAKIAAVVRGAVEIALGVNSYRTHGIVPVGAVGEVIDFAIDIAAARRNQLEDAPITATAK